jgi:hypothetical protein
MTRDREIFPRARPWLGWLVLAGEVPAAQVETSGISERLLERADLSLASVWIDLEPGLHPGVEQIIDEMEPLLLAPIERLGPEDSLQDVDIEVGLILMSGRDLALWPPVLGSGGTGRWVGDRLDAGSVVFAGAAAAAALGELVFRDGVGDCGSPGAGWLPGAVLLPSASDPADHPGVKEYLLGTDRSYALGLQPGSAVAIGPQGQVEVWSGEPPRIVLGRGWIDP